MRLTRAGWVLVAVATALFMAGRFFGVLELYLLAGMAVVAVVAAALATATRRIDLRVGRQASPTRVRAGSPARIDLTLTNRRRRTTPVLRLHDRVGHLGGAVLHLAPIAAEDHARVSYRLPTQRRGPLPVGPLELDFGDPLGLTTARVEASSRTELLVYPHLVPLSPLRAGSGAMNRSERHVSRALAPAGEEFYALRPYVIGDELKRVHWRNSARLDDLVVRQEERPRQGQVVVALDVRTESYDEAGFERAVSAAASALHAAWAGGDAVRFLTSDGADSGPLRLRSQVDAVEERLARIVWTPSASIVRTVEDAARSSTGGSLVVVTGITTDEVLATVLRARRAFGLVLVVTCQPQVEPAAGVVVHDGRADLGAQWDEHLQRQRVTGRQRQVVAR
jgi:uncharacterized protein (DUF58 family)